MTGTMLALAVEPTPGKILVRRFVAKEKSKGGIVIPEDGRERPSQGEVVAVGMGRLVDGEQSLRRPAGFEIGQHVVFTKYAGTDLKVQGVMHVLLNDQDVLAVVGPGVEVE